MKKIYEETTTLDKRCSDTFGLTSEILMEHAGLALAKEVKKRLTSKQSVLFVCGMGNNGADGMVAARILHADRLVKIYLPYEPKSALAKLQLERVKKLGVPIISELIDADVYVDALFGTGLDRMLDERMCELLKKINAKDGYKIACDIPSGILNDLRLSQTIFKADKTISMGALTLSLFNDNVKDYVGKIKVANLGISQKIYQEPVSKTYLLRKRDLRLPLRKKKDSNKGSFGHVAIVQGIKEGAAHLAAMGAFHFGAGLVSILGHKTDKTPPYLMYVGQLPKNTSVIVAGMGLEMPFDKAYVKDILCDNAHPLVIDASLCHHTLLRDLLQKEKPIVITPHPKELSAMWSTLFGQEVSVDQIQSNRFFYARYFSQYFPHVVLLLKGANTIIAYEGELFINTFGTQALAKGGSGDVLSGMIGALIAQGYSPKDATITASLAHALSLKKSKANNFAFTPIDICKGLKWLSKK